MKDGSITHRQWFLLKKINMSRMMLDHDLETIPLRW
jgi:hypothetical protein